MDVDRTTSDAACHCGAVRLRVRLPDGLRSARRCDCSMCRMRGAVAAFASEVEILSGADALTLYQFGTRTAEHWFCSVCGIYTHHRRRSDPSAFGVNVACLEEVSPFDFDAVAVNDGVNHPDDGAASRGVVGVLRYERTKD